LSEGTRPGRKALQRLAELYDLQTAYVDQEENRIEASPDAMLAALRALGVISSERDIGAAAAERERTLWRWRFEPVVVAWEGQLPSLALRLPAREARGRVELTLAFEGETAARAWRASLEEAPVTARHEFEGEEYVALSLPGPGALPFGYHQLTLAAAGHRLRARVIAAPLRAYTAGAIRHWGVFLPLYALHSRTSWGVGDLGDLSALVDWAASRQASFVGTLPLLASYLDRPFDPSPYAPVSRLFWNELFIDLMRAPVPNGWDDNLVFEADALTQTPLVDYRAAMKLKRSILESQARAYRETPAGREALTRFAEAQPAVVDYARFRAAVERMGGNWRAWPEEQRRGALSPRDYDEEVAAYYTYAQHQLSEQMGALASQANERDIGLYFDLPIGVHSDGYDVWRFQELFVPGMSVGAPPDLVTTSGQDWGFLPLKPDALRESGYEYVIAYLRHHLSIASLLRLDHVMGLHRLYWVPNGFGARHGLYMTYRAEEMYAILSLESHRNQAAIIGENLGIVPPQVDQGMAEHAISGMYVVTRSLTDDEDEPLMPIPEKAIASFGTHDMPPFATFWEGSDLDYRVALGVLDPERRTVERKHRADYRKALLAYLRKRGLVTSGTPAEVLRALLILLAESPAERVLVNLEDLWQERRPQNVPATTDQHPNWRNRARYSLEAMAGRREIDETLNAVREARRG
jgi:4-alpha-glucanotransferase